MSHLIETMAWAGETPWHSLGVEVLGDLTPKQMMDKAGLNWTVEKKPCFVNLADEGQPPEYEKIDKMGLVRSTDKKVLTVISDDWNPNQNETAFEFFHEYCMAGDMDMETAGSLKGGKMVWVLARVKDSFTILGKDKVDSYLLFSNPHEYGKAITIKFTPIRVVCHNTISLALSSHNEISINLNHRSVFDAESVKKTLGLAKASMEQYKEVASFLAQKKYTEANVSEYFRQVFPSLSKSENAKGQMSRPAAKAYNVLHTQPGHQFGEGTWWQAFNASTYTVDHVLGKTADSRLSSAWYGVGRQRKVDALETAMAYAEAS